MQIDRINSRYSFSYKPFIFFFIMATATPFFFYISNVYALGLFKVMIPSVFSAETALIVFERMVSVIASMFILLIAIFMFVIPVKLFFNMAWLFSGGIFIGDGIEIYGKTKKILIPLESILYVLKTRKNVMVLFWNTEKGVNSFSIRETWIGKKSFSELSQILRNNEHYTEDPQEISQIWKKLELNNISISGLFKKSYDFNEGVKLER